MPNETALPGRDGIGPFQSLPASSQNTFHSGCRVEEVRLDERRSNPAVLCGENARLHDGSRIQSAGAAYYERVGNRNQLTQELRGLAAGPQAGDLMAFSGYRSRQAPDRACLTRDHSAPPHAARRESRESGNNCGADPMSFVAGRRR